MKRALLVIDVQNEYFTGKMPITYPHGSLDNIVKVMKIAAEKNIPIFVIQHTAPKSDSPTFRKGSNEWEIHPSVKALHSDIVIEKNLPGSFTGTNLESRLREMQIDTVVVSGYMTQMCCDTTSRQAMHLGFNVEFLSDATGTLTISNYAGKIAADELHDAILITQAMRFSKVLTTEQWISILNKPD